jgi:2-(1,2-epoxy-1,2-dihydrophenyl)acetyl-CoA isomerase
MSGARVNVVSESAILVEVDDDGVSRITINRPEKRNALDAAARDALLAALDLARADAAVRAVLLTGAGDAFCSGADLSGGGSRGDAPAAKPAAPSSPPSPPPGIDSRAVTETLRSGSQRLIRTVWELDKPTVAAVAGPAAGLGAHLALACDLVVMAEGARLIEVFSRRGLVVDAMGAFLLPRLLGLGRAKQLVLLADDLGAEEALDWGLAQLVTSRSALLDEAGAWAQRLAQGPTRALGLSKTLLNRSFESSLDQSLLDEAMAVALNTSSADLREGMVAFLERRPPQFTGR